MPVVVRSGTGCPDYRIPRDAFLSRKLRVWEVVRQESVPLVLGNREENLHDADGTYSAETVAFA